MSTSATLKVRAIIDRSAFTSGLRQMKAETQSFIRQQSQTVQAAQGRGNATAAQAAASATSKQSASNNALAQSNARVHTSQQQAIQSMHLWRKASKGTLADNEHLVALQLIFRQATLDSAAATNVFSKSLMVAGSVGKQMAWIAAGYTAIHGTINALGSGVQFMVESFMRFNAEMTKSLAIMSPLDREMRNQMETAAMDVSKITTFRPSEAAEGLYFLASAGYSAVESIKLLPVAAKFAQAGLMDLEKGTEMLVDLQQAFNRPAVMKNGKKDDSGVLFDPNDLEKSKEGLKRMSDLINRAAVDSNATIEQIGEALTNKLAAQARILGMDAEEAAAIVETLASQGIKGQVAGTASMMILRDLQRTAVKKPGEYASAGIQVFDEKGEFKRIDEIVKQFETKLLPLSDKERKEFMTNLGFQDRAVNALLSVIGKSSQMTRFIGNNYDSKGFTDTIAKNQLESFKSQLALLRNWFGRLAIEIGNQLIKVWGVLDETFRPAAESLIKGFSAVWKALKPVFSILKTGVGGALMAGLKTLAGVLELAGAAMEKFSGIFAALLTLFAVNRFRQLRVIQSLVQHTVASLAGIGKTDGWSAWMTAGFSAPARAANALRSSIQGLKGDLSGLKGKKSLSELLNPPMANKSPKMAKASGKAGKGHVKVAGTTATKAQKATPLFIGTTTAGGTIAVVNGLGFGADTEVTDKGHKGKKKGKSGRPLDPNAFLDDITQKDILEAKRASAQYIWALRAQAYKSLSGELKTVGKGVLGKAAGSRVFIPARTIKNLYSSIGNQIAGDWSPKSGLAGVAQRAKARMRLKTIDKQLAARTPAQAARYDSRVFERNKLTSLLGTQEPRQEKRKDWTPKTGFISSRVQRLSAQRRLKQLNKEIAAQTGSARTQFSRARFEKYNIEQLLGIKPGTAARGGRIGSTLSGLTPKSLVGAARQKFSGLRDWKTPQTGFISSRLQRSMARVARFRLKTQLADRTPQQAARFDSRVYRLNDLNNLLDKPKRQPLDDMSNVRKGFFGSRAQGARLRAQRFRLQRQLARRVPRQAALYDKRVYRVAEIDKFFPDRAAAKAQAAMFPQIGPSKDWTPKTGFISSRIQMARAAMRSRRLTRQLARRTPAQAARFDTRVYELQAINDLRSQRQADKAQKASDKADEKARKATAKAAAQRKDRWAPKTGAISSRLQRARASMRGSKLQRQLAGRTPAQAARFDQRVYELSDINNIRQAQADAKAQKAADRAAVKAAKATAKPSNRGERAAARAEKLAQKATIIKPTRAERSAARAQGRVWVSEFKAQQKAQRDAVKAQAAMFPPIKPSKVWEPKTGFLSSGFQRVQARARTIRLQRQLNRRTPAQAARYDNRVYEVARLRNLKDDQRAAKQVPKDWTAKEGPIASRVQRMYARARRFRLNRELDFRALPARIGRRATEISNIDQLLSSPRPQKAPKAPKVREWEQKQGYFTARAQRVAARARRVQLQRQIDRGKTWGPKHQGAMSEIGRLDQLIDKKPISFEDSLVNKIQRGREVFRARPRTRNLKLAVQKGMLQSRIANRPAATSGQYSKDIYDLQKVNNALGSQQGVFGKFLTNRTTAILGSLGKIRTGMKKAYLESVQLSAVRKGGGPSVAAPGGRISSQKIQYADATTSLAKLQGAGSRFGDLVGKAIMAPVTALKSLSGGFGFDKIVKGFDGLAQKLAGLNSKKLFDFQGFMNGGRLLLSLPGKFKDAIVNAAASFGKTIKTGFSKPLGTLKSIFTQQGNGGIFATARQAAAERRESGRTMIAAGFGNIRESFGKVGAAKYRDRMLETITTSEKQLRDEYESITKQIKAEGTAKSVKAELRQQAIVNMERQTAYANARTAISEPGLSKKQMRGIAGGIGVPGAGAGLSAVGGALTAAMVIVPALMQGWERSVDKARQEINDRLEKNPEIKMSFDTAMETGNAEKMLAILHDTQKQYDELMTKNIWGGANLQTGGGALGSGDFLDGLRATGEGIGTVVNNLTGTDWIPTPYIDALGKREELERMKEEGEKFNKHMEETWTKMHLTKLIGDPKDIGIDKLKVPFEDLYKTMDKASKMGLQLDGTANDIDKLQLAHEALKQETASGGFLPNINADDFKEGVNSVGEGVDEFGQSMTEFEDIAQKAKEAFYGIWQDMFGIDALMSSAKSLSETMRSSMYTINDVFQEGMDDMNAEAKDAADKFAEAQADAFNKGLDKQIDALDDNIKGLKKEMKRKQKRAWTERRKERIEDEYDLKIDAVDKQKEDIRDQKKTASDFKKENSSGKGGKKEDPKKSLDQMIADAASLNNKQKSFNDNLDRLYDQIAAKHGDKIAGTIVEQFRALGESAIPMLEEFFKGSQDKMNAWVDGMVNSMSEIGKAPRTTLKDIKRANAASGIEDYSKNMTAIVTGLADSGFFGKLGTDAATRAKVDFYRVWAQLKEAAPGIAEDIAKVLLDPKATAEQKGAVLMELQGVLNSMKSAIDAGAPQFQDSMDRVVNNIINPVGEAGSAMEQNAKIMMDPLYSELDESLMRMLRWKADFEAMFNPDSNEWSRRYYEGVRVWTQSHPGQTEFTPKTAAANHGERAGAPGGGAPRERNNPSPSGRDDPRHGPPGSSGGGPASYPALPSTGGTADSSGAPGKKTLRQRAIELVQKYTTLGGVEGIDRSETDARMSLGSKGHYPRAAKLQHDISYYTQWKPSIADFELMLKGMQADATRYARSKGKKTGKFWYNAWPVSEVMGWANRYAYGDVVNTPTMGVFGEAGPEVILPLSKPKRFMELLGQAMKYMGISDVPASAKGAIFGGPKLGSPAPKSSAPASSGIRQEIRAENKKIWNDHWAKVGAWDAAVKASKSKATGNSGIRQEMRSERNKTWNDHWAKVGAWDAAYKASHPKQAEDMKRWDEHWAKVGAWDAAMKKAGVVAAATGGFFGNLSRIGKSISKPGGFFTNIGKAGKNAGKKAADVASNALKPKSNSTAQSGKQQITEEELSWETLSGKDKRRHDLRIWERHWSKAGLEKNAMEREAQQNFENTWGSNVLQAVSGPKKFANGAIFAHKPNGSKVSPYNMPDGALKATLDKLTSEAVPLILNYEDLPVRENASVLTGKMRALQEVVAAVRKRVGDPPYPTVQRPNKALVRSLEFSRGFVLDHISSVAEAENLHNQWLGRKKQAGKVTGRGVGGRKFAQGAVFTSKSISNLGVPKYAYGDVVNRPTLGVFGEAGPEVILPLSDHERMEELLITSLRSNGKMPAFEDGAVFNGRSSTVKRPASFDMINANASGPAGGNVIVVPVPVESKSETNFNGPVIGYTLEEVQKDAARHKRLKGLV